ncbi:MAG: extracellular solute-binding protein [Eubacteriales bacterium]|nr:extracellular solute-binding protein [Eubacteriales bacterium]
MMKKLSGLIGVIIIICILFSETTVFAGNEADDKITIRILHYYGDTDTDASARFLKEILKNDFPKAFPNVELVQEVYDNQTYKSKIRVLMASDELPDIMFGYGAGFSEPFVKAGKLLALDDYLEDSYFDHMNMEMQENFIFDKHLYGICFTYWTGVLYCNKELFDQAGVKIPDTYEELIEVSRRFRKAGIEPVACGMLNKWHGQQWINNFTIQLGGASLYNDMAKGKQSLDNHILAQAAQLTSDLVSADVFCSNMYQLASSEAEEMFLNGDAAMIYIGSWYTSAAEERLGDKLEVAKMPAVPGARESGDYHGGAINGWMVSSETKYPETAANIAAWLGYELSCCQPQNATFNLDKGDERAEISAADQKILDLYSDKTKGGVAWDTLMWPDKAEIWLNTCSQLFEGKLNGQEFAKFLGSHIDQEGYH